MAVERQRRVGGAVVAQSLGEADLPPRHLTRSRVEVIFGVPVLDADRVLVVGAGGPCECVARAQRSARGRRAAARAGVDLSCAAVAARVHRPARVHRQPIAPRRPTGVATCSVVDGLRGAESSAGGERLHTAYSTVQYSTVQHSTQYSTAQYSTVLSTVQYSAQCSTAADRTCTYIGTVCTYM